MKSLGNFEYGELKSLAVSLVNLILLTMKVKKKQIVFNQRIFVDSRHVPITLNVGPSNFAHLTYNKKKCTKFGHFFLRISFINWQ